MNETILELFMKQVSEKSEKPALIDPAAVRQITYRELDEYSSRVAAKMKAAGVKKGDNVALILPNSIDQAAAMLAAMKLRAAFAPLNGLYPKERLGYICQDCQARLVVTPDFFGNIAEEEPLAEAEMPEAEDIAVLIYTSGSTGSPKGVMIDQRGLYGCSRRFMEGLDWRDGDILGLGAPFFFVARIQSLFVGLSLGLTCVLIPMAAMRDPRLLGGVAAENRISVTFISPKILQYFTPVDQTLRRVVVGSERLAGIASDKFDIVNSYGLSESIGGILAFKVEKAWENTPVGSPLGEERV